MCIDRERAFKLLPRRSRIPVLQADSSGVVVPLLDTNTVAPFLVSTKKLRRAFAGRQRQVLCTARADGHENGFFARTDEFVAVDPERGAYVILSPLIRVLGTRHGRPLMADAAPQLPVASPSQAFA
jgi:hypothetical protein